MESLIYNYYGYQVDNIKDGVFKYQDYVFLLVSVNDNEIELKTLSDFNYSLKNYFTDLIYFVTNKYGRFISQGEDNTALCLLAYKESSNATIDDILTMQTSYINNNYFPIDLSVVIKLWEERYEYIINQCLVSLNFENEIYKELYDHTLYASGLAMNAMQYLADLNIDYKVKYPTTLNHRRIKKISKFELFNPFNFIIDHSSRDLAELYKNDLITLDKLLEITYSYHYQVYEYEYLLARVMYPTFIFDLVEDIATADLKNKNKQIAMAISNQKKQIKKIKDLYKSLSSYYNMRPIGWLN